MAKRKIKENVIIIGAGIGAMGLACLLGKAGYRVSVYEKNSHLGGRANVFSAEGFVFDMGPSWYLMPDVFADFFQVLGEDVDEHLRLQKLSPSYRVTFAGEKNPELRQLDIYSDLEKDIPTLEKLEPGVGDKLRRYLKRSGLQYELAKSKFMYRNYNSVFDFVQRDFIKEGLEMNPLETMESYLNRWFADERLKKVLEYTLVFLGSAPNKTPALYNIMNFIDFEMGVYYPQGGIYKIIEALESIALKYDVTFYKNAEVLEILTDKNKARGVSVKIDGVVEEVVGDWVVSNADMHFTETKLIKDERLRTYKEKYWQKAQMGPSAFIIFLGLSRKLENLTHHNLRFAENWQKNFAEVFDNPCLPEDPSYYVSCPSKTDATVAPEGKETVFVLVPLPAHLKLSEEDKQNYRDKIINLMKVDLNIPDLEDLIEYESLYTEENFRVDYNAFGGTALGMAHTLKQTLLRPQNRSKKIKNLLYLGAGTNPGIGMPVCLISAELAFKRIVGIKHPAPLNSSEVIDNEEETPDHRND